LGGGHSRTHSHVGTGERLSASDMSSLLAERGPIHVHVGGTAIFDGEPPPFDELLEHVEGRLRLVPRFRKRLADDPVGIANPVWADDARFDLRWHLRHAGLPRPGYPEQLRDLVGRIMSQPLDLSRPLWQLYLIEGLEDGRFAAVSKTHHALVDGVSALDVGVLILDVDAKGSPVPETEPDSDPDEPRAELLLASALQDRIGGPLRLARRAAQRALAPRDAAASVLRTAEGFMSMAASGPGAPRTFLNVEIGRDRRVAFASTTLSSLKRARGSTGATVNDVVLSVACGALRRSFERRGEELPEQLVALVPMSVRRPGEKGELGNRIATLFVPLPLAEPDPLERLSRIASATRRLKSSEQARAASLVIEAAGWTPPTINRVLAGAMARPLTWNLAVSNVPGPQLPIYLLGRRLREIYPFVPLSPQGHALSIGVLSYDGQVFFGLAGDRDVLADIDELAGDVDAAIAQLSG
jgi:diacylglycerol O-acyltransferase / wax synthase